VHHDVLEAGKKETLANCVDRTRSVSFIALSRHKKSLTILIDVPVPVEHVENAKVQSTFDLSKSIHSQKKIIHKRRLLHSMLHKTMNLDVPNKPEQSPSVACAAESTHPQKLLWSAIKNRHICPIITHKLSKEKCRECSAHLWCGH